MAASTASNCLVMPSTSCDQSDFSKLAEDIASMFSNLSVIPNAADNDRCNNFALWINEHVCKPINHSNTLTSTSNQMNLSVNISQLDHSETHEISPIIELESNEIELTRYDNLTTSLVNNYKLMKKNLNDPDVTNGKKSSTIGDQATDDEVNKTSTDEHLVILDVQDDSCSEAFYPTEKRPYLPLRIDNLEDFRLEKQVVDALVLRRRHKLSSLSLSKEDCEKFLPETNNELDNLITPDVNVTTQNITALKAPQYEKDTVISHLNIFEVFTTEVGNVPHNYTTHESCGTVKNASNTLQSSSVITKDSAVIHPNLFETLNTEGEPLSVLESDKFFIPDNCNCESNTTGLDTSDFELSKLDVNSLHSGEECCKLGSTDVNKCENVVNENKVTFEKEKEPMVSSNETIQICEQIISEEYVKSELECDLPFACSSEPNCEVSFSTNGISEKHLETGKSDKSGSENYVEAKRKLDVLATIQKSGNENDHKCKPQELHTKNKNAKRFVKNKSDSDLHRKKKNIKFDDALNKKSTVISKKRCEKHVINTSKGSMKETCIPTMRMDGTENCYNALRKKFKCSLPFIRIEKFEPKGTLFYYRDYVFIARGTENCFKFKTKTTCASKDKCFVKEKEMSGFQRDASLVIGKDIDENTRTEHCVATLKVAQHGDKHRVKKTELSNDHPNSSVPALKDNEHGSKCCVQASNQSETKNVRENQISDNQSSALVSTNKQKSKSNSKCIQSESADQSKAEHHVTKKEMSAGLPDVAKPLHGASSIKRRIIRFPKTKKALETEDKSIVTKKVKLDSQPNAQVIRNTRKCAHKSELFKKEMQTVSLGEKTAQLASSEKLGVMKADGAVASSAKTCSNNKHCDNSSWSINANEGLVKNKKLLTSSTHGQKKSYGSFEKDVSKFSDGKETTKHVFMTGKMNQWKDHCVKEKHTLDDQLIALDNGCKIKTKCEHKIEPYQLPIKKRHMQTLVENTADYVSSENHQIEEGSFLSTSNNNNKNCGKSSHTFIEKETTVPSNTTAKAADVLNEDAGKKLDLTIVCNERLKPNRKAFESCDNEQIIEEENNVETAPHENKNAASEKQKRTARLNAAVPVHEVKSNGIVHDLANEEVERGKDDVVKNQLIDSKHNYKDQTELFQLPIKKRQLKSLIQTEADDALLKKHQKIDITDAICLEAASVNTVSLYKGTKSFVSEKSVKRKDQNSNKKKKQPQTVDSSNVTLISDHKCESGCECKIKTKQNYSKDENCFSQKLKFNNEPVSVHKSKCGNKHETDQQKIETPKKNVAVNASLEKHQINETGASEMFVAENNNNDPNDFTANEMQIDAGNVVASPDDSDDEMIRNADKMLETYFVADSADFETVCNEVINVTESFVNKISEVEDNSIEVMRREQCKKQYHLDLCNKSDAAADRDSNIFDIMNLLYEKNQLISNELLEVDEPIVVSKTNHENEAANQIDNALIPTESNACEQFTNNVEIQSTCKTSSNIDKNLNEKYFFDLHSNDRSDVCSSDDDLVCVMDNSPINKIDKFDEPILVCKGLDEDDFIMEDVSANLIKVDDGAHAVPVCDLIDSDILEISSGPEYACDNVTSECSDQHSNDSFINELNLNDGSTVHFNVPTVAAEAANSEPAEDSAITCSSTYPYVSPVKAASETCEKENDTITTNDKNCKEIIVEQDLAVSNVIFNSIETSTELFTDEHVAFVEVVKDKPPSETVVFNDCSTMEAYLNDKETDTIKDISLNKSHCDTGNLDPANEHNADPLFYMDMALDASVDFEINSESKQVAKNQDSIDLAFNAKNANCSDSTIEPATDDMQEKCLTSEIVQSHSKNILHEDSTTTFDELPNQDKPLTIVTNEVSKISIAKESHDKNDYTSDTGVHTFDFFNNIEVHCEIPQSSMQISEQPINQTQSTSRHITFDHSQDFKSKNEQENKDNNNPAWQLQRMLASDSERYQAVRNKWKHMIVPNPQVNLTTHNFQYRQQMKRATTDSNEINSSWAPANIVSEKLASGHNPSSYQDNRGRKRWATDEPGIAPKAKRQCTVSCAEPFDRQLQNIQNQRDLQYLQQQMSYESRVKNTWNFSYEPRCEELRRMMEGFNRNLETLQNTFNRKYNKVTTSREEMITFKKFYSNLKNTCNENVDMTLITQAELTEIMELKTFSDMYANFY